jgi:hypothetical protein
MALPPCCAQLNEDDFEPQGGIDGNNGYLPGWKPFELLPADSSTWQKGGDAFEDWIIAHRVNDDAPSTPEAELADSADAAATVAGSRPDPPGCSARAAAGVSIYALPKTGFSFLSQLAKQLSVLTGMCRVHEVPSPCATFLSVACPPGQLGGRLQCSGHKTRHAQTLSGRRLSRERKQRGGAELAAARRKCSFSSQANRTFRLPPGCCEADEPKIDPRVSPAHTSLMPVGEACPADRGAAWLARAPTEWLWRDASLRAFRFANHTREQRIAGVAVGSGRGVPAEPGKRIPAGGALLGAGFVRGPVRAVPDAAAAPAPFVFEGGRRVPSSWTCPAFSRTQTLVYGDPSHPIWGRRGGGAPGG